MNKKAMIQAMLDGKTLVLGKAKAYYDEAHVSPFRRERQNNNEQLKGWHGNWKIQEEPKQITDRFKLMTQIMDRRDRGEQFLVRIAGGSWRLPSCFIYNLSDVSSYRWTAIDKDGNPIGDPQKFVEAENE